MNKSGPLVIYFGYQENPHKDSSKSICVYYSWENPDPNDQDKDGVIINPQKIKF
jgi:hypothetical protein